MNNYIRICLSLDDETVKKLKNLSGFYNRPLSKVVKMLIDKDFDNIKGN